MLNFVIRTVEQMFFVVFFLLGDSPATKFYTLTFRNTVCSTFITPPMKLEQTECSETSVHKIQKPENRPKERLQHSEHGESVKSRYIIGISKSKRIRWVGNVARMGKKEMRTVFLMGKSQGITPVGTARH